MKKKCRYGIVEILCTGTNGLVTYCFFMRNTGTVEGLNIAGLKYERDETFRDYRK
jgi:hypothetical protein